MPVRALPLALAAALGVAAAAASARRRTQDLPVEPTACNASAVGSGPAANAEEAFDAANAKCIRDFADCVAAGAGASCLGMCDAALTYLSDGCYTGGGIFCRVVGDKRDGVGVLPAFHFESAQCVPADCGPDLHDAAEAAWRARVCGPYWGDPACAIALSCNYDLPSTTIWIIVGSCVGAVAACALTLGVCHWYYRRRYADDDEEEDGDGEGGGGFADLGGDEEDAAEDSEAGRGARGSVDPVAAAAAARWAAYGGGGGVTVALPPAPPPPTYAPPPAGAAPPPGEGDADALLPRGGSDGAAAAGSGGKR